MKKTAFLILCAMMAVNCTAADGGTSVKLPSPDKKATMTLFEALQNRRSVREFSDKEISRETLSSLLWAATGVNREKSGLLTAPTAVNAQDISVYVADKNGVSLYNPKENSLKTITKKDIRADLAERQKGLANAPVFLLLVSDISKFRWKDGTEKTFAAEDAGYVSQNIDLAVVALGLATVPRHMMDRDAVKKALGLSDTQLMMLNHPVGYPAEEPSADKKKESGTKK